MQKNARLPFITEMIALFIIPFEEALALQFGSVLRIINILTILLAISTKKMKIGLFQKRDYHFTALMVFLCYIVLSGIWSPYKGLYLDTLSTYALYTVLIVVLNGLHPTEKEMRLMLSGLQFGGAFAAVLLLFGGGVILNMEERTTLFLFGRYIDPNLLAYSLAASFVINLYFLMFDTAHKHKKLILWIMQALLAAAVVKSGSRGSFVSVIVVTSYMLIRKPIKVNKTIKRIAYVGVAALVFIWFYNRYIMNSDFAERFTFENLIGQGELGTANRFEIWEAAFKQFAKRPLFGYGNGSSPYAIGAIYKFYGTHNSVIMVLLEFGIVGFALFVTWLVWEFIHAGKTKTILYELLLISLLLFCCFIEGFTTKVFWGIQIIIMLARPLAEKEVNDETLQSDTASTRRIRIRWR